MTDDFDPEFDKLTDLPPGVVGIKCRTCSVSKPASSYWSDRSQPLGRDVTCSECRTAARAGNRKPSDPKWDATYREKHAERFATQRREWEARNPIKAAAQRLVRNAVRAGRLYKPSSCESCGKADLLHGHHEDYSQPLAVRWLCPSCHKAVHKELSS